MSPDFRVFFRSNRQFFDVYLHDVHPNTFEGRGGGRWGYFIKTCRNARKGKFGEIHLVKSRVRHDTVSHELDHLRMAWCFARWIIITPNNEEWFCRFGDELTRKFWRKYEQHKSTHEGNRTKQKEPKVSK